MAQSVKAFATKLMTPRVYVEEITDWKIVFSPPRTHAHVYPCKSNKQTNK